jgi:hypothetical protein
MYVKRYQVRFWRHVVAALIIILIPALVSSCGAENQPTPLPVAAVTPVVTAALTPTIPSRAERATAYAQQDAEYRTVLALSLTIDKSRDALGTPGPTWTPELGMLTDCPPPGNSVKAWPYSCWRGVISGHITDVQAGRYGSESDGLQGILIVNVWPGGSWSDENLVIYDTPQLAGPVRIVSMNGTLFTLAPVDISTPGAVLTPWASSTPGTTFVFDLATRQWVGTPGPSPSASVSPLPSVSPMPTVTNLP